MGVLTYRQLRVAVRADGTLKAWMLGGLPVRFDLAEAFCNAIAGPGAVMDYRALHDKNKAIPGIAFRGTFQECWPTICKYNEQGYGIFAVIAALDGNGNHLLNVQHLRAHYVDLDNLSALQNYERAAASRPPPAFAVQSSPGKFHVYWLVQPYTGNDYFQLIQRKLRQVFDGDKAVIDAARVMRLPGTIHAKGDPQLVTMWPLAGWGQYHPVTSIADALQAVNIIDGGAGVRHDLGEPSLAAPDLGWLQRGLALLDPNTLTRGEWIALTSAFKQAGWTLADQQTLFNIWSDWCGKYAHNDPGENLKQWNSIRNTELGWQSFRKRCPGLMPETLFTQPVQPPPAQPGDTTTPDMPTTTAPPLDCSGEYLTHFEQQEWFKGCTFIVNMGEMLAPDGRYLNSTQFNVSFGGKKFIIDGNGKMINEAWQAATRSTLYTVPKVDHTRFLPSRPHREVVTDEMGRKGINVFTPQTVARMNGDVMPFLNHMAALIPDERDRHIILSYMAHNAKYPGFKIPWAPVIQSAEGAGKGVMKFVMRHCMGKNYTHFPKANELATSGAQFNAWLRHKLFILVDEVKVDERRELIEVLKPLISEEETEIQAKGFDQELEDNYSNWMFFTNWKDAIPINKNGRRFAIFYSPLQTKEILLNMGMDERYFVWLYGWLKADGCAIVAEWLLNYPIERGAIPMRAPDTSSTQAALGVSRSPIERVILEAVEDGLPGFRGGWVSVIAAQKRVASSGAVRGAQVSPQTVSTVLESMGYTACGRAPQPYFHEDKDIRAHLYRLGGIGDVGRYAADQGYSG